MRPYWRPFYSSAPTKNNEKRRCLVSYQSSAIHNDDRLRGLARHLTYDHFRTLFSAKDSPIVDNLDCFFHYDIIAELPVEIIQNIFLYLPLYQCFKAQRVSRRWRKLLSAPQTIECLLRWWYPRGETDLCIPTDLSVEAIMIMKAEHVDAFRTGHPFSKSTLDGVPDNRPAPPSGGITYARGVLAWINPDTSEYIGRSIETLDLKTHLRRHFIAEDRTSFHTIAISSSIIAALDLIGRCHVWDIHCSNKSFLLQLPSAGYDRIEASGPALAIASSGQNMGGKTEVFTWSSQSMKLQSFLLPLHPVQAGIHHEWKMMLDPKGESFFLFQIIHSKRYVVSDLRTELYDFYFTRTSFDGRICAQGQSEWLSRIYSDITNHGNMSMEFRTVEVNDSATLWLFCPFSSVYVSDSHPCDMIMTRICFNFERSSFEVKENKFASAEVGLYSMSSTLVWKDIIYWGDLANTGARIMDFKESTCEKTKLVSNPNFDSYESIPRDVAHLMLGDETFLIHVGRRGWKVYCFDKNIQLANEDLGYRYTRLKNSQEHVLPGVP